MIERLEEAISQNFAPENLINDARSLGDNLLGVERNKKNFDMQKQLFQFQQSLLDVEANSEQGAGEGGVVEKSKSNAITRKFTKSVEMSEQKHQCPYCSWTCENFKSLQRHVRGTHKDKAQVTSKAYQDRNQVICLAAKRNKPSQTCFKRVEKNRICQHLALSHNIHRPPKMQFRGFLTDDDGSSPYDVCWRAANEPDPPLVELVAVENQESSRDVDGDKQDEMEVEPNEPDAQNVESVAVEPQESGDGNQDDMEVEQDDPPEVESVAAETQEPSDTVNADVEFEPKDDTKNDSEADVRIQVIISKQESQPGGEDKLENVQDPDLNNILTAEPEESESEAPMMGIQGLVRDAFLHCPDDETNIQIVNTSAMGEKCKEDETVNFDEPLIAEDIMEGGLVFELDQQFVLDEEKSETQSVQSRLVNVEVGVTNETIEEVVFNDGLEQVAADLEPEPSKTNESEDEDRNFGSEGMEDIEYTIDVDVLEDGSFRVVDHEEVVVHSPQDVFHHELDEERDSQESIFISSATTGHMEANFVSNEKSGPVGSSHNTGYHHLPWFPEDAPDELVYVSVLNKAQIISDKQKKKRKKKMNWSNRKNRGVKVRREISEDNKEDGAKKVVEGRNDEKLKKKKGKMVAFRQEEDRDKLTKEGEVVEEDSKVEDEDSNDVNLIKDVQGEVDFDGENEVEYDSADSSDETGDSVNRWERRNSLEAVKKISSLPVNKAFIDKFTNWWQNSGASFVTKNKDTSTLRSSENHLFFNKDSFLNFQTSEDESFNLSRLINFDSEDFLALPSPISWLTKMGGKSGQDFPSIRKSMYQGHARLRAFILHLLNEHSFSGEAIQQKSAITSHLNEIDEIVKKKKLSSQFEELYQQQKMKKEKMQNIVKPFEEERLHNSVETWFQSKESEELEIEALTIYETAVKDGAIRNSDFDRFVKICFFEAALFDKSRVGMLESLKNEEYFLKRATWLPPEMDELELDKLPPGWLLYSPPYEGAPASSYQIEIIAGEKSKNHQHQSIVMNPRVHELIEKMRTLKEMILPEIKLEDYLFVNHSGKKLPKLQNYPGSGSLLYQFGLVVGIDKFCFKMFRKKAEGVIQGSASLAKTVKDLNSHSQKVGEKVYDQRKGARRNVFLTNLSKKEGGCSSLRKDTKLDESEKKRREDRDKSVKDDLLRKAKQFLEDLSKKERPDFRPTAIQEHEVETLKTLFDQEARGKLLTHL